MDKKQQDIINSILGYVSADGQDEAKKLLNTAVTHSANSGISADAKGEILTSVLGTLLADSGKSTAKSSSKSSKSGGGLDLGGLLGTILGDVAEAETSKGKKSAKGGETETTTQVVLEILPSLLKLIKPEDMHKVKDLLMQLLGS